MKKINVLILLLAIFVAMTVFVSCGGQDSQDTQNTQDANDSSENNKESSDEEYFIFKPLDDGTYAVSCDAEIAEYLTKIVIPSEHNGKNVSKIAKQGFKNLKKLQEVTIPNTVTIIDDGAFMYCYDLTSAKIPDSVTSIGSGAFDGCSKLTSVAISKNVTNIGVYAFYGCCSIEIFEVDENNPNYCDIDGVLFTKDKKTVICYPARKSESSFTIPDGTTNIISFAFERCANLKNIVIPNSVTSIDSYAFQGCSNLESITLPFIGNGSDVTCFGYLFGATDYFLQEDDIPKSLKTVILTGGTAIPDFALSKCSSITNIEIPDTITYIGNGSFANCKSLTSIVIPNSVTHIGSSAFNRCSNLTYNEFDNGLYIGNTENPYLALVEAKNTDITSCIINEQTKFILSSAFSSCNDLTSIEIPNSVISIGSWAFQGCSALKSIVIPNTVTSMGELVFKECSKLTIYCEAENWPDGWHNEWNHYSGTTEWGYEK